MSYLLTRLRWVSWPDTDGCRRTWIFKLNVSHRDVCATGCRSGALWIGLLANHNRRRASAAPGPATRAVLHPGPATKAGTVQVWRLWAKLEPSKSSGPLVTSQCHWSWRWACLSPSHGTATRAVTVTVTARFPAGPSCQCASWNFQATSTGLVSSRPAAPKSFRRQLPPGRGRGTAISPEPALAACVTVSVTGRCHDLALCQCHGLQVTVASHC